MEMTWLTISTPSASRRIDRATVPAATRAAVSRAEDRSRMLRASVCPYFSMPLKSAWPGRGRVRVAPRAPSSSAGSTGSALMTVVHLGHSVLPIMMATGDPSVRPWRTPPSSVTSSASNFMRAPRP